MLWIVEYVVEDCKKFVNRDKVQASNILQAKRNTIAKTGIMNIKFLEVKPI